MLVQASGAQRASRRRGPGRALAAAVLATLLLVPGSVAGATVAPAPARADQVAATYPWAPWITVEAFYFNLLNCTRTGGWVQKDGSCTGYGSGRYSAYVPPLKRNWGITDKVSRPYAKLLAVKAKCSHFLDGDPSYRLRRAGYYGSAWGENIGCRDGYTSAKAAVLASHLLFQSEKSANGGHWKNIKNPRYSWVGVGVWVYGSRTRLVTDFYR